MASRCGWRRRAWSTQRASVAAVATSLTRISGDPARCGSVNCSTRTAPRSVAVVLGLERPGCRDAEVALLLGRHRRELRADAVEVQPRYLLVQRLRQHVHAM